MGLSEFVKDMIMARQLHFGKGRFEMMGIRGLILPTYTFARAVENVHEHIGKEETLEVLFETGRDHGKLAVELARENDVTKRELIHNLVDSGNVMGMGEIEVAKFNPEKGVLQMDVHDIAVKEKLEDEDLCEEPELPMGEFIRGCYHEMSRELFNEEVESKIIGLDEGKIRVSVSTE